MRFFRGEEGSLLRDLGVLSAAFGLLFFQFLGRVPLIDPDEGRYVEIPREMLERGDFVTPTLNYVKYFEKPPLHYWLNALSLRIFGENEFAARFPGALCGLLTVLLTYCLGRRLFGRRTGLLAATLLGTAVGFMVQSRINFTDMTLTFCLTAAFAFSLLASREGAINKARDYYLFYLSMALAVLAKGLIGVVLPGAVIFLYLAAMRRWRLLKEMRLLSGGLLFLAVSAPWFVLVSLRNPEFPHFFFIHEHFERFLTKAHHRYQPLWFFIPVLAVTMIPWSLFIPAALKKGWRERKTEAAKLFLLLWAGVIFAFFSKSNSKLVPYILPVFPPLALLIGNWFAGATSGASVRRHAIATATLLAIVGAAILAYPFVFSRPELGETACLLAGGMFIAAGVAALTAGWQGEPVRLFAAMAASAFILSLAVPPVVYDQLAPRTSAKELSRVIREKAPEGARIACYRDYQQGIPFYTHRRVILVGDRDELEFGSLQGDNSAWFMDGAAFAALWQSPETVLTVLKRRELPKFQALVKERPAIVSSTGDKLLVVNHPLQLTRDN